MTIITNNKNFENVNSVAVVNSTGGKERFLNVRISYINGILTSEEKCRITAGQISCYHGFTNVHFVHDRSYGFLKDVYRAATLIFSETKNESEIKLAELWKKLFQEMNEHQNPQCRIYHYAHSRGGLVTQQALELLSENQRKKITIYCFGSPALISSAECGYVENIRNTNDPVPFTNPAVVLSSLFPKENFYVPEHQCKIVGSEYFGSEHGILDKAYTTELKKLGKSFLKEQLVNSPKVEVRKKQIPSIYWFSPEF